MKYKYFVGNSHHTIHYKFLKSVLGGEYVYHNVDTDTNASFLEVLAEDGEDVIWFFSNWFLLLHPLLKGKQVFTEHGLSFKPSLNPDRVACINKYFDMVFSSGVSQRDYMLNAGVDKRKIKEVGYTTLFEIPDIPVKHNHVLFSVVHFGHWNEYDNILKILQKLDTEIQGFLTIHPAMHDEKKKELLNICKTKSNVTFVESQEDLLKAFSFCECIVGGSSSVCTSFWYLKKPVILIRGRQGRNPFFGWFRVKRKVNHPLFSKIIDESTKLSNWRKFSLRCLKSARIAPSAQEIFFPWNFNREITVERIKHYVKQLEM
jgi:hypothetical protein